MCILVSGSYSCIDMSTDPRHCGDAGVMCAMGETCMDGMCTCSGADGGVGGHCPDGLTCTSAGCIDTMTDPANCGGLGTTCRAGEHCIDGSCHCGTSATDARCMGGGIMGCGQTCCGDRCVYVDDYNCGGCGMACTGGDVCVHMLLPAGMPHCGTEGAFVIACDAPEDASPIDLDAGVPDDAAVDDAATDDAAVDDASTDAYVDPG
jgi:hypothetical protein